MWAKTEGLPRARAAPFRACGATAARLELFDDALAVWALRLDARLRGDDLPRDRERLVSRARGRCRPAQGPTRQATRIGVAVAARTARRRPPRGALPVGGDRHHAQGPAHRGGPQRGALAAGRVALV